MNKINITIPDNLTPEQEALQIAKKLAQKLLGGRNNKQIGVGFDIKEKETRITITRETKEKSLRTRECPVCNHVFTIKNGFPLWFNFGGPLYKKCYCSEECRSTVKQIAGDRAFDKRSNARIVRLY